MTYLEITNTSQTCMTLLFSGFWHGYTDENAVVYTSFDHSYNRQVVPAPFILGSTIAERQQTGVLVTVFHLGKCLIQCIAGYFTIDTTGNAGNGTSNNTFAYTDTNGNTYDRGVDAAYNVIIYDQQSGSLATSTLPPPTTWTTNVQNAPLARLPGGKQLKIVG